jgi:hypothetical protein
VKGNRPKRTEKAKGFLKELKLLMAEYEKRAEVYIRLRTDGLPVHTCLAAFLAPLVTPQPENLLLTLRNRRN